VITRITETDDGSFRVAISSADVAVAECTVATVAEAFALQAHAAVHGEFPAVPRHEPEMAKHKKVKKHGAQ
jgi:hypothetical protein